MSRSKNRKIADLISGGTFDDGVVAASEVTGLATVATSGSFSDLSNQPTPFDPSTLGTASTQATGAFATAAQGTTADAALPKAGGAVTGNVTFGDNDKAIFGAGSDLQIYHDGAKSVIQDAGTGNLELQASTQITLWNAARNKVLAVFRDGDYSKLYHNNAEKIATTSSGIDVTGTVNADALTGIGSIDATTAAAFDAAGVGGGGGLASWNPNSTPSQTFSSSGTWTKPSGYSDDTNVIFFLVGGGSGGSRSFGTPFGLGGRAQVIAGLMGELPSSITVTVGAGGAGSTGYEVSTNSGGSTKLTSNSIVYETLGSASSDVVQPAFPFVSNPFVARVPAAGEMTAPITATSTTFSGGMGGNFGAGRVSLYAGNGGAGSSTSANASNGVVPGGGGGMASYSPDTHRGGNGGNGSVRVYYITP